jgi:hypothetical protein
MPFDVTICRASGGPINGALQEWSERDGSTRRADDAGYIKSPCQGDGKRWISVVA